MLINPKLNWSAKTNQKAVESVSLSSHSRKFNAPSLILPTLQMLVEGQQRALHFHSLPVPKEVVRLRSLPPWISVAVLQTLGVLQHRCGIKVLDDLPGEGGQHFPPGLPR